MNILDQSRYGYPLISGYNISTDFALINSSYPSAWSRQRRTFVHNASLINLTWRLTLDDAKALREWLQQQQPGDFFQCSLISGNDINSNCQIEPMQVRRVGEINEARISRTNISTLQFQVETRSMGDYEALFNTATGLPEQSYPKDLPLPQATMVSSHGDRNKTQYTLQYRLNSAGLARWLSFAGYVGTAWFTHPMVSTNVLCGSEAIRYTSEANQNLVGPDSWEVSITAETMPAEFKVSLVIPVVGDCTYDGESSYDDPTEIYDCPGVTPPQGDFTMPSGPISLTNDVTGSSPLTGEVVMKLNRDGTVVCQPQSTPVWLTWHTNPTTLPQPAVACSAVCEVSLDNGVTWIYTSPRPGGTFLSLKGQDVWFRLKTTSTYDLNTSLPFELTFEPSQLPSPIQFSSASVTFNVNLNVTDPTGVVDGAVFNDGYSYTIDPGDTVESVSAGVGFTADGRVLGLSTNALIGSWYLPNQVNAGQNLWIILNGSGTGSGLPAGQSFPPTGVRLSLGVVNYFSAVASSAASGRFATVSWNGTYQIYNAQSGGTLLGSGSINLESEVSQ